MLEAFGDSLIEIMDLLIHTEASKDIGLGHVMRCSSLAEEGRRRGLDIWFSYRDAITKKILHSVGEKNIIESESKNYCSPRFVLRDYRAGSIPGSVQKEIDDGSKVMLLDDLGPSRMLAHFVVDVLMTPARSRQYLHGDKTHYLYGLEYALLHPHFYELKTLLDLNNRREHRLCICFGGKDALDITPRLIKALNSEGFRGPAIVIGDPDSSQFTMMDHVINQWNDSILLSWTSDIGEHICQCDLIATKVGQIMLEAFCLEVGCILIEPTPAHVMMQKEQSEAYEAWPCVDYGLASDVNFCMAAREIILLFDDIPRLKKMGLRASELVDGKGAKRIMDVLLAKGNDK